MLPTICFLGCYRAVLLYMDIMTNSVSTGSDIAKSLGILRRGKLLYISWQSYLSTTIYVQNLLFRVTYFWGVFKSFKENV